MKKTYIDEIVDYPYTVVNMLSQNKSIVSLLLNDMDINVESNETENKIKEHILDFDYVENVVQTAKSFIFIDTLIPKFISSTIKHIYLTILVVVDKDIMRLPSVFKVKGNRRDNLVREIDYVLQGSQNFGIGKLQLKDIKPATINHKNFSCKLLIYEIPNFANGEK